MNTEQTVSAAVALRLGGTTFDEPARPDQRHRRLRVIELADLDTHDGLCALWLATIPTTSAHAHTDSTLHRQQFILHELAHMILGHCEGDDCTVDEALRPISCRTPVTPFWRQDLDSETEIAAESSPMSRCIRGSVFAESAFSEIFG